MPFRNPWLKRVASFCTVTKQQVEHRWQRASFAKNEAPHPTGDTVKSAQHLVLAEGACESLSTLCVDFVESKVQFFQS